MTHAIQGADFFTVLLLFLGSGLIFVFLFKKLGMGSILGYLAAGILLGPNVLHAIENAHQLEQISELGIVLFLFLVGLELSPARIVKMKRAVFGLGPLQVLFSTAIFSLIFILFKFEWREALVLGSILSLSS